MHNTPINLHNTKFDKPQPNLYKNELESKLEMFELVRAVVVVITFMINVPQRVILALIAVGGITECISTQYIQSYSIISNYKNNFPYDDLDLNRSPPPSPLF